MIIFRRLKVEFLAIDLLLYLWAATVVGGLLYLAVRGDRRDLILHVGLTTGIGLTVAAAGSVGLWLMLGGWGAPAPVFFGTIGLIGGIIAGLSSFERGPTQHINVATGGGA